MLSIACSICRLAFVRDARIVGFFVLNIIVAIVLLISDAISLISDANFADLFHVIIATINDAIKLAEKIEKAIFSLEEQLYRGAERKHGFYAFKGYRQMLVENYIIIYEVFEK